MRDTQIQHREWHDLSEELRQQNVFDSFSTVSVALMIRQVKFPTARVDPLNREQLNIYLSKISLLLTTQAQTYYASHTCT